MARASFHVNVWRKVMRTTFCYYIAKYLVFHAQEARYGHFTACSQYMQPQGHCACLRAVIAALEAAPLIAELPTPCFDVNGIFFVSGERPLQAHGVHVVLPLNDNKRIECVNALLSSNGRNYWK